MLMGISLAAVIAASPVTISDNVWKTQLFVDTLHKINYGEVIATNAESKLTVDDRTAIVQDIDGKFRSFVIDAFKTDIEKEYPQFTTNFCGRGHVDCPYIHMWKARHAIYKKQDEMRLKWLKDQEDLQKRQIRRSLLFRGRDYRFRYISDP